MRRSFTAIVTSLLLAVVLLPIYWMVAASLKSNKEITQDATLYPHAPTFGNYIRLLSQKQFDEIKRVSEYQGPGGISGRRARPSPEL